MSNKWKKGSWYSILAAIILFVGIFYVGFSLGNVKKDTSKNNTAPVSEKSTADLPQISISTQNIKEENFTGKMPVISGPGPLVSVSKAYIKKTISDFRTEANTDVPAMRKEFGVGSPPSTYEIDIDATHVKSTKTESIVMTVYTFTGGAHGSSLYKVITAAAAGGKILSLSGFIKKDQQTVFTEFLKKELNDWRPEGSNSSVVFPDDVSNLKFSSFDNWSLDDRNLTIYFDQDEIGPGVLGAVAFPIPLEKITAFINPSF